MNLLLKIEVCYRLDNFKDCIMAYQGKNKLNMSDEDIEEIKDYTVKNYGDEAITRSNLVKVCKALCKNINGNETALLMRIDPDALDDISHLEDDLINDFKEFSKAYDELTKDGKKLIFSQSILIHLLRRRGHNCRFENISYIINKKTMKKHNDICGMVFERLGWDLA